MPKKASLKTATTKKVRKSDFSIFLLKDGFDLPEKLLKTENYETSQVTYQGQVIGTLYTKSKAPSPPAWMKNFKDALIVPWRKLESASASAVFHIEAKGRHFALTYGYGRSMLNDDAWEQDFGLKVVLNSIDPEKIRQIERSSFDSLLQNTSSQSVREAAVDEFGLDVEQDVIRSMRGSSKLGELGIQIRGRDSLHLHLSSNFDSLAILLSTALEQFEKDEYKAAFPFIDKMSEIRAPDQIAKLDGNLVLRIQEGDPEKLWLAVPEVVLWQDGSYLRYSSDDNDEARQDILLSTFKESLEDNQVITLQDLKTKRVTLHASDGPIIMAWKIYRCIYCEVERDGMRFILNNGKWYKVDQDYAKEVQDFYTGIQTSAILLPSYSQSSEGEYNETVAAQEGYSLMDKKMISIPSRGRIQTEFCDLFDRKGKIIHVKRYSGSSELSHLFAQGLVSAEMFLENKDFRLAVNAKLPSAHKLEDVEHQPKANEYEVVFAIISSSTKPGRKDIPFFSKVNLRSTVKRLEGRGYKVTLADIRHG